MPDARLPREAPPEGGIRGENLRRILAAAERVFAASGHAGATTAAIAAEAGLPKANVHYYFSTKRDLYRAVLADILREWLDPLRQMSAEDDPARAIAAYVEAKMRATRDRPLASRVFANEILHGAAEVRGFLADDLKRLVDEKAAVLERWIAEGRMAPVDSRHFFFMIWAVTQHYADFDVQVRTVLGKARLGRRDFDAVTAEVVRFILRGAGLAPPADR